MDMTLGTWRVSIQRIPPTSAELEGAGLADVRQYAITAGPSVARWMSVACVGRKQEQ